jgi:hypothetical protein
VGCVPTGATCDTSSDAPYCDGDDLMECDPTFERWVGLDCSAIGTDWGCDDSTDPPECLPDVSGWTCVLDVEPECDCDDVVFCNPMDGTDLRLECPDYGFRTCGDTEPTSPEIDPGCIF